MDVVWVAVKSYFSRLSLVFFPIGLFKIFWVGRLYGRFKHGFLMALGCHFQCFLPCFLPWFLVLTLVFSSVFLGFSGVKKNILGLLRQVVFLF